MRDPAQALTAQFFAWESRGRGWQLWSDPVVLEPPFVPFFRVAPPSMGHANDNRRPSLVSAIADRLRGRASAPIISPEAEFEQRYLALYDREPDTDALVKPDEPVEFQVVLPTGFKSSKDIAQEFLLVLGYCRHPIAFEIIGLPDSIVLQIVCRDKDDEQVVQQLRTFYPEIVLERADRFLLDRWLGGNLNEDDEDERDRLVMEFGLCNEFMLPLRVAKNFDVDPLAAVIGALENLRRGEIGVFQVLLQPVHHPWAESVVRSVTDYDGKPFFADAPELVSQAKQKVSSPLFAGLVRLAAKSERHGRAMDIARNMGSGLAQLANPMANEFIPLSNDDYDDDWHERDLVCRQTHRSGMILSTDELLTLVHMPGPFVRSEKLKRLSKKTKAAPGIALGNKFALGENFHNGKAETVSLSPVQRVRHMHVIGASGTGKSTFLLNLIMQDIERGEGVAVLDPHGDLIDQVLARLPEKRFDDVVLVDPSDSDFPVGFNILQAHSELEKNLLASDLVGVFKRLATSWGDQMTSVLGNAVLAFLESNEGGTLADLRRFLVDQDFRKRFVKTVQDPEVAYYWQKEFPLLSGKPQAPILTRLDTFLRPKLIRYMVSQKENRLDFGGIMNQGRIFLAKLSQGAIGEENAYLLGSLIVSKFHQLALCRQEQRASDRRPFYLYIDEFPYFVTPSMASILSGVRKYQLGLVLAHQEMRQLGKDSEIGSAILANPFARVCFRLGDQDAAKLASGFSFFDAKDLQNLGTGEAIARIERAEYDFNLRIDPLPEIDTECAEAQMEEITSVSRRKFATPRSEVEAHLNQARGEDGQVDARPARRASRKPDDEDEPPAPTPVEPTPPPSPTSSSGMATPTEKKSRAKAKPKPGELPALGKGGREHKYLQQLVKQLAEGMGWRATIEKEIAGGSIDVALEKGQCTVACEISITSTADYEMGNIEKCFRAGFGHVVVIAADPKQLSKVEDMARDRIDKAVLSKIRFVTPDSLFSVIEGLEAEAAGHEGTVRGYRVKVRFHPVSEEEKAVRKQAISKVITTGMRRLKKKD
ncbi:hypothetical protein CVU37_04755 [candidate division BRC1 bacterium HGW-BRC1-1]|jgi:hypothetical protein|nr:MAG: hypothetical protein CVU37_04755 [candidate division BRC1 bacterium HGW-BRC1-1]